MKQDTIRKMIARAAGEDEPLEDIALSCLEMISGRVARQMFDAECFVEDGAIRQVSQKELLESAEEPALFIVLRIGDATAMISLDGLLVNALVELATGAPQTMIYREKRVPTLIDFNLSKLFVDALLLQFQMELAQKPNGAVLPLLEVASHDVEARRLRYQLRDGRYVVLEGRLVFNGGARGGTMSLALPKQFLGSDRRKKAAGNQENWSGRLGRRVLGAHLPLRADLEVLKVDLGDMLNWKPGTVLDISGDSLGKIRLGTPRRKGLFTASLGQIGRRKAVTLGGAKTQEATALASPTQTMTEASGPVPDPDPLTDFAAGLPEPTPDDLPMAQMPDLPPEDDPLAGFEAQSVL